jgi:Regulator of ribonuclease activity B
LPSFSAHDAFAVTVQRGAKGDDWLVLARKPMFPEAEIEAVRPQFEALAEAEGGKYDGWEVEIPDR